MNSTNNIATPGLNIQQNDGSSSVDNVSNNTSSSLNQNNISKESQSQNHRTVTNFNHVHSRYHAENTDSSSYHIFRPADQTMSSPLRVSSQFTKRDLNPKVHSLHHPYLQVNYNKVQSKSTSGHNQSSNNRLPYPSRQYNSQYYQPQGYSNVHSGYYLLNQQNSNLYTSENPNHNLLYNNLGYGPHPNKYARPVNSFKSAHSTSHPQNYVNQIYPSAYYQHNPASSNINTFRQIPQPSQKKSNPKQTKCCDHNCSANSSKKSRSTVDYSHITFPKLSASTGSARPNQLSLADKMVLIGLLEQKVSIKYLSEHYNVPRTSIYGFLKNKEKISNFFNQDYSNPERKRLRKPEFEFVDRRMGEWLKQMRGLNVPISGPMCMAKALYFHSLTESEEPFAASEGWLRNFRARYGITFQEMHSKSLAVEYPASHKK